jgi:hypothetical protein
MTTRFLPFLLILLGIALPLRAQTPAQTPVQTPDPPRFLLESIVVEGVQRDPVREIVAAESLLQPGREYSEQELREAVYRVKRLPFVLDAEFSLRKGGDRGSYQLVITVEETRLFFYSADIGGIYDGEDRNISPGEDRIDWGGGASLGGRWFVGSQGLVFASVQGFDTVGPAAAQVGYTRYNLFGRGGFASVALATSLEEDQGDSLQGSLSMGVPIVGNHSLRADLDWYQLKDDSFSQSFRRESQHLGLAWIYDTTDDPLFPTSGTRLTAAANYAHYEDELKDPFFASKTSTDTQGLYVAGTRHWALTHRQSVFSLASVSWSDWDAGGNSGNFEEWLAVAGLGHSMNLWGFEKTERIGDFRWENTLELFSSRFDSYFSQVETTDLRLTTGLVFRNTWGVMRLSFTYVDNLEQDYRVRQVL